MVEADNHNHNYPASMGCVGELITEGPSGARGYMNNPENTKEVFIKSKVWTVEKDQNWLHGEK